MVEHRKKIQWLVKYLLLSLDVLAYGGVRGQTILAGDHLRVGGREVGRGSTNHRRLLLIHGEVRLGLRGDGDQPRDHRPPELSPQPLQGSFFLN